MSACDLDRLESLVLGELDRSEAATARAHAASCGACAVELAELSRTRGALAGAHRRVPERISQLFPLIAERTRARRVLRRQLAALTLTFASLAVVIGISSPSIHHHEGAERSCARQCVEADFCALPSPGPEDEIARLEQQFSACLIATPAGMP